MEARKVLFFIFGKEQTTDFEILSTQEVSRGPRGKFQEKKQKHTNES